MNILVVHRDRRGAVARIEEGFDVIRASGVRFAALNLDALSGEGRAQTLAHLAESMGEHGKVRLLMHSIARSEEHTSELQSLMRISYAVFCLKKKKDSNHRNETQYESYNLLTYIRNTKNDQN